MIALYAELRKLGDSPVIQLNQIVAISMVEGPADGLRKQEPGWHDCASTVRKAIQNHIKFLPENLKRSLTWDQGKEMAELGFFESSTKIPTEQH